MKLPNVLTAVHPNSSAPRVFLHLYNISDENGLFELNAAKIAHQIGFSRKTVYKVVSFLQRVRLLFVYQARTGRGKHSIYQLNWRKPSKDKKPLRAKQEKFPHPGSKDQARSESEGVHLAGYKDPQGGEVQQQKRHRYKYYNNINIKQSKDYAQNCAQSKSIHLGTRDYLGPEATKVHLIPGARFYRQVMKDTRLQLERWILPEQHRSSLEGMIGNRIDGMALSDARVLINQIYALRNKIEDLAESGVSPQRMCSFVAGKLAGVPDRARREVLKRTDELIDSIEQISLQIWRLTTQIYDRTSEYRLRQVCQQCGYVHTENEFNLGYQEDGSGKLNCFGVLRTKIDELTKQREQMKQSRQESLHRQCSSPFGRRQANGFNSPPIQKREYTLEDIMQYIWNEDYEKSLTQ